MADIVFEEITQTCETCGAVVASEDASRHAEWHRRMERQES